MGQAWLWSQGIEWRPCRVISEHMHATPAPQLRMGSALTGGVRRRVGGSDGTALTIQHTPCKDRSIAFVLIIRGGRDPVRTYCKRSLPFGPHHWSQGPRDDLTKKQDVCMHAVLTIAWTRESPTVLLRSTYSTRVVYRLQ